MTVTFSDKLGRELCVPDGYRVAEGVVAEDDMLWWEGPPMFPRNGAAGWHAADEMCEGHAQVGRPVSVMYCVIRKVG